MLENTDGILQSPPPSLFSRGGSLLPSIYADARYIDAVDVSKAVSVDIITILLEYGAEINAKDNSGNTALHHAVAALKTNTRKTTKQIIRATVVELLKHGADLNAVNHESKKPADLDEKKQITELHLKGGGKSAAAAGAGAGAGAGSGFGGLSGGTPPSSSSSGCSACTYINASAATSCAMCANPLGGGGGGSTGSGHAGNGGGGPAPTGPAAHAAHLGDAAAVGGSAPWSCCPEATSKSSIGTHGIEHIHYVADGDAKPVITACKGFCLKCARRAEREKKCPQCLGEVLSIVEF